MAGYDSLPALFIELHVERRQNDSTLRQSRDSAHEFNGCRNGARNTSNNNRSRRRGRCQPGSFGQDQTIAPIGRREHTLFLEMVRPHARDDLQECQRLLPMLRKCFRVRETRSSQSSHLPFPPYPSNDRALSRAERPARVCEQPSRNRDRCRCPHLVAPPTSASPGWSTRGAAASH